MSDPPARELKEALERETATAAILQIIASSPADTQPVFDAIVHSGLKLFPGALVSVALRYGDKINAAAVAAPDPARVEAWRRTINSRTPLARDYMHGAALLDRRIVDIPDVADAPAEFEAGAKNFLTSGNRAITIMPMMRGGEAIGLLSVVRLVAGGLSDEQLAVLRTFAAQAVIAIENTRLVNELRQRTDSLSESLAQQTAISDILRVIANSPGEVKPVFETVAEHAARICEAPFVGIVVVKDGMMRPAVNVGGLGGLPRGETVPIDRTTVMGRSISDKQPVHVADPLAAEHDFPHGRELALRLGHRTILSVPLIHEGHALGAIVMRRTEVRPFEDKHVALLKTFADQAAIAIENARLLKELRQRTDDLSESLEQQTATSEVLKVISRSPGALEPVFQAMLENAVELCEAKFGVVYRYENNACYLAGIVNAPPAYETFVTTRGRFMPDAGNALDRALKTKQLVHTIDQALEAVPTPSHKLAGARSQILVPMLKEQELVGAIAIFRQEVRPFSDKQIELVTSFAAQAVIAIENTRLLTELRQRTDDLSEALEQQTATSEVLRIISSSPGELEAVFNAVLSNVTRICGANFALLWLAEGDQLRSVALHNVPVAYAESRRRQPTVTAGPGTVIGRVQRTKRLVQVEDITTEQAYQDRDPVRIDTANLGGARTLLGVPLLKDDEFIGVITVYRQEARLFTEKQIELATNFAAQAVIAIENTRLLSEVRQQASQLEAQSAELRTLNQQLEQRVDDQVGEIERMGRLRRFLPPQVADLIVSSGSEKQLESHRREITALFCDLRGFTGFSETADPEDVMALLREYHKAIGEIIFRHGGTLERFAGDGVMVIFGDPVPLPNPALAAVQMALEMRAAIGVLIEKWRRLGHELGFGIGISHGFATLGTIGFEGRFDYAAIGTVSNVASRLCDEAKPGQILVSPRVLLAVEDAVTVEPVAEMALKGIRRPILVHNVIGAAATIRSNIAG